MAAIARVKLRWTGFLGGPGYSIFHFRDFGRGPDGAWQDADASQAADHIDAWADGVRTVVAESVRLKVESDVEMIDEASGELINVLRAGVRPEHKNNAAGTGGYSGAAGAVVNWKTGGVRNGRRVRGRTFIVPCYGPAFGNDGTLADGTRLQLEASSANLINGAEVLDLGVYARPTVTRNPDGSKTKNNDGVWHKVTSATVPDLAAVLRSRRD